MLPPPGLAAEDAGEHFGLELTEVAHALEGLAGAVECREYMFVEQYSDWESEGALRARRATSDEKRRAATRGRPASPQAPAGEAGAGEAERRAKRAAAVAEERARVAAMTSEERDAFFAQRLAAHDASRAAGEADKAERAAKRDERRGAERAAKAVAKEAGKAARDALKLAMRERAAAEREEQTAAKTRRAKYPIDDSEVAAAEAADAAAEGRMPPRYPPRPATEPAEPWTGDALALAAFFEERLFLSPAAAGLAAAPAPDVAAVKPAALRAALASPGCAEGAALLSELYSAMLRALSHAPAWDGDSRGLIPPPMWARVAARGGFAVWPELLRRWARYGCRFDAYDETLRDAAYRCAAGGPSALAPAEHCALLLALVADLLDTAGARRALEAASEKREELKKAGREEAKLAREAANAAADAARDARRRVDGLVPAAGAEAAANNGGGDGSDGSGSDEEYRDAGAGDDSDSDYGGRGGGRPRSAAASARAELAEAKAQLAACDEAAAAAVAERESLEARQAKALAAAAVRAATLGYDAAQNRYWWSAREPGAIYVEDTDPASGGVGWGRYTAPEDLDALIAALNPNGLRESRLREALERVKPKFDAAAEKAVADKAAAEGGEGAAAAAAAVGTDAAAGLKRSRDSSAALAAAAAGSAGGVAFEAAALTLAAGEALHICETVVSGGSPELPSELRGWVRGNLREYAMGRSLANPAVVVSDLVANLLAFEDAVCRAVDPRAAGLTKAAARAAESAARKAERAAALAEAGIAPEPEPEAEAEPMEEMDEEEAAAAAAAAAEADPLLDEALSEIKEANAVETKPSGGTSKPLHPPMWRQAAFRDAWRAALQRCAEAATPAGAAGPLAYAVCSLAERTTATLASLCPKEFRKRPPGAAPPRAPAPKRPRSDGDDGGAGAAALDADTQAYERFRESFGRDIEEGDVPRCLARDVLEALCLQHTGRDVSRQKLAKHKIARMLPPDVLSEAMQTALAEKRAAVDAGNGGGEDGERKRSGGGRKSKRPRASGGGKPRRSSAAASAREDDGDEEEDDEPEGDGAPMDLDDAPAAAAEPAAPPAELGAAA